MSSTVNWSFVFSVMGGIAKFYLAEKILLRKKYKILNKIFSIELSVYLEKNHNRLIIDKSYKCHKHHSIQDMSRVASASVHLEPRSSSPATPSCTGHPSSHSHGAMTSGFALSCWSHVSQWTWWLGHHEKLFLLGWLAITM